MPLTRDVIAIPVEALGTDVYVPRFTAFMFNAIMKRAEELYPLPDPKPYEQPMPDAVIEGDVIPATQNPAYVSALTAVMMKRNQFRQDAILSAVQVKDATHEEVVAVFIDMLTPMRQYANLPEDNFVAALRHCALKPAEYIEVINAATKELPLSQEEIRDGLRIFRRDVQRDSANGHHRESDTPDLQEAGEVQTQQPAG